jgi:hypothetical protein
MVANGSYLISLIRYRASILCFEIHDQISSALPLTFSFVSWPICFSLPDPRFSSCAVTLARSQVGLSQYPLTLPTCTRYRLYPASRVAEGGGGFAPSTTYHCVTMAHGCSDNTSLPLHQDTPPSPPGRVVGTASKASLTCIGAYLAVYVNMSCRGVVVCWQRWDTT